MVGIQKTGPGHSDTHSLSLMGRNLTLLVVGGISSLLVLEERETPVMVRLRSRGGGGGGGGACLCGARIDQVTFQLGKVEFLTRSHRGPAAIVYSILGGLPAPQGADDGLTGKSGHYAGVDRGHFHKLFSYVLQYHIW